MPIVTILTDFGQRDSYVAQMKGVILSICPEANIVDITHSVERHNIVHGAFLTEITTRYFPKGVIHLAVVDPGVGTTRLPVVVVARDCFFVAPDNGLVARAANRSGILDIYKIDVDKLRAGRVSNTFHGRDVFARAAGMLASGIRPNRLGSKIQRLQMLKFPRAVFRDAVLECSILHIDAFGNLITSASNLQLRRLVRRGPRVVVRSLRKTRRASIARTYSDIARGELMVLEGSQGYIEVSSREGDAEALLQAHLGEKLKVAGA